jgi:hypothetical protein
MIAVRKYNPVNRVYIVRAHMPEIAEGVVHNRHMLAVLGQQSVVKFFRAERIVANYAAVPASVEHDRVGRVGPRASEGPKWLLSVERDVRLIGSSARFVYEVKASYE